VAHGEIVSATSGSALVKLIDAAAANSNGEWIDCGEYRTGIIVVTGNAAGTTVVNVHVSNSVTKPAAASAEFLHTALGAGLNGYVAIPSLAKWLKASVTAYNTGTIVANALLRAET
jgi:hypothetical protein